MGEPRLPKNIIDQADWGHPSPYGDRVRWPNYYTAPPFYGYVLHWQGYGSIGSESAATNLLAKKVAYAVRRYHVETRGWYDAAYNAMAWSSRRRAALRLRGSNHNGANKDSNYFGGRTFTVLFPTGTSYPIPHRRSLKSFAWVWGLNPAPVTGHGLLPTSPGGVAQDTQCPGPWLKVYIKVEGWLDTLAAGTTGARYSWQTSVLKRRLTTLGRWSGPVGKRYSENLMAAVRVYQEDRGLPVTGYADRDTWRQLGLG